MKRAAMVLFAAALFAQTARANDADASAVTATSIVNTILQGENLAPHVSGMAMQGAELAEFAALAGCRPNVGAGSSKSHFFLIYGCDSVKGQQAPAGYLLEMILENGTLKEIWLNPEGALPPTAASTADKALPNRTTLAKQFVRALSEGSDPTLAGLVAVTPSQMRRLSAYQGCSPTLLQASNRNKSMYRWRCDKPTSAHQTMTELHFDDKGRPVGLSFGKLITRTVITHG